jgi:hypothetical protein
VWPARGAALSPRAASALLLALALHAALLLCFRPSAPPRGVGEAAYPLLSMRLYAPSSPRPFAASTPKSLPTRGQARHPAMAPSILPATVTDPAESSPGSIREAGAPPVASAPTPIASPAPQAADRAAAPALDIDKLKAVALRNAGDGERRALPDAAPTLSGSDKAQRALEQARRPKCDKDYRPSLGPVGFAGLLTLPFMLKEGASDSGCRW